MAISAYVGVPGSGKSYEVVKSVILPAFCSGRRIVTNIVGITESAFIDYAVNVKKCDSNQLGTIINVSDDDVIRDDFFPFKTTENIETVCKSGDLIAIDELWRIWSSDTKIPANHRSFIAEHRHFTDEKTGLCCDLVVINQSVANLPRFLKDRIETTYRMSKHVSLGLKNRYRVDVFNGTKLFKNNRVTYYQEKYDIKIFGLYSSYDGINGTESTTDKRQNVFANKRLLFLLIFVLLMFVVSVFFIYKFFSSRQSQTQLISDTNNVITPVNSLVYIPQENNSEPEISTKWRIAGELHQNGKSYVILNDNSGVFKLEPASNFRYNGMMKQGIIDNEIITRYSGRTAQ